MKSILLDFGFEEDPGDGSLTLRRIHCEHNTTGLPFSPSLLHELAVCLHNAVVAGDVHPHIDESVEDMMGRLGIKMNKSKEGEGDG